MKPLGGYMTRVFAGERTFLSPVLRPVERGIYRLCGVDEKQEQHWVTYAVAMLLFSLAGFVVALCAAAAAGRAAVQSAGPCPAVEQSLAFNTAVSFVTNTNWQSYVPETTMSYLVADGRADRAQFRVGRDRHRAGRSRWSAASPGARRKRSAISGSI